MAYTEAVVAHLHQLLRTSDLSTVTERSLVETLCSRFGPLPPPLLELVSVRCRAGRLGAAPRAERRLPHPSQDEITRFVESADTAEAVEAMEDAVPLSERKRAREAVAGPSQPAKRAATAGASQAAAAVPLVPKAAAGVLLDRALSPDGLARVQVKFKEQLYVDLRTFWQVWGWGGEVGVEGRRCAGGLRA